LGAGLEPLPDAGRPPALAEVVTFRGVDTVRVVREARGFAVARALGVEADDLVDALDVDVLVLDPRALDLPAMEFRLVCATPSGPSATPATLVASAKRDLHNASVELHSGRRRPSETAIERHHGLNVGQFALGFDLHLVATESVQQ